MNEVVVELLKIWIMEFRFIFVNVALLKKFELWRNNWSLQINGRIIKSRFIWISQSRFIFCRSNYSLRNFFRSMPVKGKKMQMIDN